MSGGSTILRLGAASQESADAEAAAAHDETTFETAEPAADVPWHIEDAGADEWFEPARPPLIERILAPAMWAALLIWTAFYIWAQWPALSQIGWNGSAITGLAPSRFTAMLAEWALPVLLMMIAMLVARRTSTREAQRFADVASVLRSESELLEARLRTVNSELSLAREFISAQSRDLDSLGRVAGEKLSAHADHIAGLISTNGEQIDAIASVSANALDNMERLRGHLPVIANSAKDVTNQIANSGRVAQAQLKELIAGFNRINEFGQASEHQVLSLRERIDTALADIAAGSGQLLETTQTSYNFLANETKALTQAIAQQEAAAQASLRDQLNIIATEGEALRSALTAHEDASLAALKTRLDTLRGEADQLYTGLADSQEAALANAQEQVGLFEQGWAEARARMVSGGEAAAGRMQHVMADLALGAQALQGDLARQADSLLEAIDERRRRVDQIAGEDIDLLEARLADWEATLAQAQARQLAEARKLAESTQNIAAQIEACEQRITALRSAGAAGQEEAAAHLQQLAQSSEMALAQLGTANSALADVTDGSVRLLELIQASSQHTEEHLPLALVRTEERLDGMEGRIFAMRDALAEAGLNSSKIAETLATSREMLDETQEKLAAIGDHHLAAVQQQHDTLAQARSGITEAESQLASLAETGKAQLDETLARLRSDLAEALGTIPQALDDQIDKAASRFREDAGSTLEQLVEDRLAVLTSGVTAASARAVAVSKESAERIEAQLARVDELAGNLETRISAARDLGEQGIDGDFTRRMALITESLNSTAIDIAKLFSNDVSDTAWQSYLRGDRGVFTRRAVRLLDNAEAKSIAQHYDNDPEFRDSTNRYIHDFEAMLRNLLSTRDGNALSVTLLSSDMGKLYVALAQGIERLRH